MRYVIARWKKEQQDVAYRIYVTDTLKLLAENTAALFGGKTLSTRYFDIVSGEEKKETRTKDDIIDSVKAHLAALGGE